MQACISLDILRKFSLVARRRDACYPTPEVSGSSTALPIGRMGAHHGQSRRQGFWM